MPPGVAAQETVALITLAGFAQMAGHQSPGIRPCAGILGQGVDKDRGTPARPVKGRLAKSIGAAAKISVPARADVAHEVDEVGPVDTGRDPVSPRGTAETGRPEVADLEHARGLCVEEGRKRVCGTADERQLGQHLIAQHRKLIGRQRAKPDQDFWPFSELGGVTAVLDRFAQHKLQPVQTRSSEEPFKPSVAHVAGRRVGL